MKLRIATRRSKLALTQTRWVARAIKSAHPDVETEEIHVVTRGDRVQDRPLHQVGGKALFVSEVEAYVVRGEADLAVHSLKDVPGDVEIADGCRLACFPRREDPHDVFLTRDGADLMDLPAGSRVGTTSLRRVAQLRAQRPDLDYRNLRGNVDTRLRRLDDGDYDAIVLAAAGLTRLELLAGRPHVVLPTETCLPAVGQGTLALECRADDERTMAAIRELEDAPTRLVTEAERAMLKTLKGSCRVPIAGFGRLFDDGTRLQLQGLVGSIDGDQLLQSSSDIFFSARTPAGQVEEAIRSGHEVANALIAKGARELMAEAEATLLRREKHLN